MSEFNISIPGGESKRLKTGGKYCPSDIVVTAEGSSDTELDAAYEEGRKFEYDRFWDRYQNYGNRTQYDRACGRNFAAECWSFANFYPKYDIRPVGDAAYMFYNWSHDDHAGDLAKRLEDCGVVLDTSQVTNARSMFAYGKCFTRLPALDFSQVTDMGNVFVSCAELQTIDKLTLGESNTPDSNTFYVNRALENVVFDGVVASNYFNFSSARMLSHDSLISFLNILKDFSGTGENRTLTLGTENLAKLTDAEKAIATGKGWTLA